MGIRIVEDECSGSLQLIGELDMANADELDLAITRTRSQGLVVILDMSRLGFIDSTGMHVILRHAVALDDGSVIVLRDPSTMVMKMLEILGADRLPLQVSRT